MALATDHHHHHHHHEQHHALHAYSTNIVSSAAAAAEAAAAASGARVVYFQLTSWQAPADADMLAGACCALKAMVRAHIMIGGRSPSSCLMNF